MGVWGWTEFEDNKVLEGTVEHVSSGVADDGDWCFMVKPAPGFEHLLRHPGKSHANHDGFVECEVEPPGRLKGEDAEDDRVFQRYMSSLAGRHVRVIGTWVSDCSHSYAGGSCFFGCCGDGKTEIHPITSILSTVPPSAGATKKVEVFVFSDSSGNFPAHVPHSGTSRVGEFNVTIGPVITPQEETKASFQVVDEVDMAASKHFDVVNVNGQWVFQGIVVSGTESQGKGFYHAFIDLRYVASKHIQLSTTSLEFEGIDLESSQVKTFDVRNIGSDPLSVSIPAPPADSGFRWDAWQGTMQPGTHHRLSVDFSPTHYGEQSGEVVIVSDAPGSPHHVVLGGRGRSPECPELMRRVGAVGRAVEDLRNRYQNASDEEKPALLLQFRARLAELKKLRSKAMELGCATSDADILVHLPPLFHVKDLLIHGPVVDLGFDPSKLPMIEQISKARS